MNKFELPNNNDLENILKKNLDNTKPLEMKEKDVSGKKSLFPFWTPVANNGAETFYDADEYLSAKDKALRDKKLKNPVGIVEPKSEFKTNSNGTIEINDSYDDYTIVGKMQQLINKINNNTLSDKTGAVTSKSDEIGNKTTKPITTQNDGVAPVETTSHAASPKGDNVGIVKPKGDGISVITVKQSTINNDTKPNVETTSYAASPKGNNVGIVKPKGEGIPTNKTNPIITNDTTESNVEEESNAVKPNGDNVGIVKPTNELEPQNTNINFDKYMAK